MQNKVYRSDTNLEGREGNKNFEKLPCMKLNKSGIRKVMLRFEGSFELKKIIYNLKMCC